MVDGQSLTVDLLEENAGEDCETRNLRKVLVAGFVYRSPTVERIATTNRQPSNATNAIFNPAELRTLLSTKDLYTHSSSDRKAGPF